LANTFGVIAVDSKTSKTIDLYSDYTQRYYIHSFIIASAMISSVAVPQNNDIYECSFFYVHFGKCYVVQNLGKVGNKAQSSGVHILYVCTFMK